MPVYEYKCATCGKHFELIQSMSDGAKKSDDAKDGGSKEKEKAATAGSSNSSGSSGKTVGLDKV